MSREETITVDNDGNVTVHLHLWYTAAERQAIEKRIDRLTDRMISRLAWSYCMKDAVQNQLFPELQLFGEDEESIDTIQKSRKLTRLAIDWLKAQMIAERWSKFRNTRDVVKYWS